jgi:hypothetical protein
MNAKDFIEELRNQAAPPQKVVEELVKLAETFQQQLWVKALQLKRIQAQIRIWQSDQASNFILGVQGELFLIDLKITPFYFQRLCQTTLQERTKIYKTLLPWGEIPGSEGKETFNTILHNERIEANCISINWTLT